METLVSAGEVIFGAINGTDVDTYVCGHDYSGSITVVDRNGDYMIWRKGAGTCWSGRLTERTYVPVEYWLVSVSTIHTSASGREITSVLVHESVLGKEKAKVNEMKSKLASFTTPIPAKK
jgi:hypothetical protein